MRFVLNGQAHDLDAAHVEAALSSVAPEPVREFGVRVNGTVYPVKQALAVVLGVPRTDFQSQTARRHLTSLGFEVLGTPTSRSAPHPVSSLGRAGTAPAAAPTVDDPHGWPWEGHVQSLFAAYLHSQGWLVTAMADTATKAPGVDLLASKEGRRVGAEVKGFPSVGYADPRRASETKKTQPSTQAGHWFSQALMKALMLLDSHPGHESLMVLPDYPRYRDLAQRTRRGRGAAGVHVVFVGADGSAQSETWKP